MDYRCGDPEKRRELLGYTKTVSGLMCQKIGIHEREYVKELQKTKKKADYMNIVDAEEKENQQAFLFNCR